MFSHFHEKKLCILPNKNHGTVLKQPIRIEYLIRRAAQQGGVKVLLNFKTRNHNNLP